MIGLVKQKPKKFVINVVKLGGLGLKISFWVGGHPEEKRGGIPSFSISNKKKYDISLISYISSTLMSHLSSKLTK